MIQEKIEELRSQMQKIASDKDLTDPEVVSISEKLDLLINEFYIAKKRYCIIIRHHHEKWDGTGYFGGLKDL